MGTGGVEEDLGHGGEVGRAAWFGRVGCRSDGAERR